MSLLTVPASELLDNLFEGRRPRMEVVGVCLLRFEEVAPLLRLLLEKAADGRLDPSEEDLFFVGFHILAGGRDRLSFKPLLRLLHLPPDELEWLLGDALTEVVGHAAVGMFDGDVEALLATIADGRIDDLQRGDLLGALTFLTWEKRIDLDRTVAFLERFDDERLAVDGEFVWSGWEEAVALLGLEALAGRVEAAFRDGRLDETISNPTVFRETLADSLAHPGDIERFRSRHMGYLEDVGAKLEQYSWEPEEAYADDGWLEPGPAFPERSWVPVVNPWRSVGRNDPCPCGSGKKFKKCCLDKVG